MTEPDISQPEAASDAPDTSIAAEPPSPAPAEDAAPEPWTPERVNEWNAYSDIYVVLAALLLTFTVSCNFVTDSHVWLHLKSGQLIAEKSGPMTGDPFSYTEADRPWVNVHWLFDWGHAALYKLVHGLVPVNPADETANRASADQVAIGALAALAALARLLTAWTLIKIRHRGPGLWWSALCVVIALGTIYHPLFGITMGGIAGAASVAPATWGQLLLAVESLILFRAFCQGKAAMLWLLIPIFAIWANIDESFLTGLLVLAAAVVGRLLDGSRAQALVASADKSRTSDDADQSPAAPAPKPVDNAAALAALVLSALACLANPYTYHAYLLALEPYLQMFQPAGSFITVDQLSFFGPRLREQTGEYWYLLPAYFLVVVALGLGSFLVNAPRFSFSRFLPFALLAVIWGILIRFQTQYAIVYIAAVAPNLQEWYHEKFGTEGRLGWQWSLWSTGGRLVTLAIVFLMVGVDITGYENKLPSIRFGLGYQPDEFPLKAAEFLQTHKEIKGNVLNTSFSQGDILIWQSAPDRKTYVDGRQHFFPQDLLDEWKATRRALADDNKAEWKPVLDKYNISILMIDPSAPSGSPATYRRLMESPNWIPFYDDGSIVLFGRSDAPESDLAMFKANRLDANLRAFSGSHPVAGAERPPNPTTWIDRVFQNRTYSRPRSRTESSRRWLEGLIPNDGTPLDPLPEPARCLLAIQDARTALATSPDDWIAFRRLKDAYRFLQLQESALLAGIALTPENRERIRGLAPNNDILMSRYRQRVTSLNFAIQTTPPPVNDASREELARITYDLYNLYLSGNALDLARDRLKSALELAQTDVFPPEMRAQLEQQLAQLNQRIDKINEKLEDMTIESQAGPLEQAQFAVSQGGIGRAIEILADAERSSVSLQLVKPRLIDLYCSTGQPDKALELLAVGAIDDPNLGTEPGVSAYRQGLVYFLLGNYISAATLWQERAIPRVRFDRVQRTLMASQGLLRGEQPRATSSFLSLPGTLNLQASWEYDIAICQLEAGLPDDAAEHFTKALNLAPDMSVRPIAAYYLEKMGKPVPPPPKNTKRPAATKSAAPASPAAVIR